MPSTVLNRCQLFSAQIYREVDRLNILRDNLEESFTVNVMGVHWVTREFLPLLKKGGLKKVANM